MPDYGGGIGGGGGGITGGGGWVPPEDSGIPPGPEESIFDQMIADMGLYGDSFAADLLFAGWFDPTLDYDRRAEAREMFFDYTGLGEYEFDWDAWREWYGEGAAA